MLCSANVRSTVATIYPALSGIWELNFDRKTVKMQYFSTILKEILYKRNSFAHTSMRMEHFKISICIYSPRQAKTTWNTLTLCHEKWGNLHARYKYMK